MTVTAEPEALLSHLHKTDGSATYSYAGYTVIGAVNGPIEAQKRDELPEEAILDVIVRPAAGVGGTRERHLESLIQSTLRQIILTNNFPRTVIQVILQITLMPENEYVNAKLTQSNLNLPVIPALLQTAIMSLLSASIPMTSTLTSTSLAIILRDGNRETILDPTPLQIEQSESFHVLAFTSRDELVLAESEGTFTINQWDDVYNAAYSQCCTTVSTGDPDISMSEGSTTAGPDMKRFIRSTIEQQTSSDLYWK
ncbi:hypothetical protein GGS20DRAFT_289631 [Poronia punctata]|nr:hypothetical protein GGS20DRAFT_289631 [Poronia punctata]